MFDNIFVMKLFIRRLSIVLAVLLSVSLLDGCVYVQKSLPAGTLYAQQYYNEDPAFSFTEVIDAAKPVTKERLLKYYDLTYEERLLYDQIAAGIGNFELRIPVDFNIQNDEDAETLRKVSTVVFSSYPDPFWWTAGCSYTINGSPSGDGKYSILPVYYVDGKKLCALFDDRNEIIYPSNKDIAAAKLWIAEGKSAIRDRLSSLPVHGGMSPIELEMAVYAWMRDNVVYERSRDDDSSFQFKNTYGAIINGRADCVGYSHAFQYIMGLLGIECVQVLGLLHDGSSIANAGEGHAWNAVRLDGEWYHLDVTNDSYYSLIDGLSSHYYFNRTDRFMADNGYTRGGGGPEAHHLKIDISCTETKYNYYAMTDSYLASDSDFYSKVPARLSQALENGERVFDMELDPSYAEVIDLEVNCRRVASDITGGFMTYYSKYKNVFFCVFK